MTATFVSMPGTSLPDSDVSGQLWWRRRPGTVPRVKGSCNETASRSRQRCISTVVSLPTGGFPKVPCGAGWLSGRAPGAGFPGFGFRERTRLLEFLGSGLPWRHPGPLRALLRRFTSAYFRCHRRRARTPAAPDDGPHLLGWRSGGAASHRPRRRGARPARGALSAGGVSRDRRLPRVPQRGHTVRSSLDLTHPEPSPPGSWQRACPRLQSWSRLRDCEFVLRPGGRWGRSDVSPRGIAARCVGPCYCLCTRHGFPVVPRSTLLRPLAEAMGKCGDTIQRLRVRQSTYSLAGSSGRRHVSSRGSRGTGSGINWTHELRARLADVVEPVGDRPRR